jgi:tRNA1Val (adenine37-N6)-methyltransferase
MPGHETYTDDSLFDGRIRCHQHSSGYRFSLDAVLLGNFISVRPGERVLDLGCGSAIVALILAYRWPSCQLTGLEIQPDLAQLARDNVARNNWQERIRIVPGDLRRMEKYIPAGQFDWVVSNPPYRKTGTGRMNSAPQQLVARHETKADIAGVVGATVWALKNKGRAAFIYPAARGATLLHELKKQGLEPKKLQAVYSYPGSPAVLLLVEAVKGGGEELCILEPFYVYQAAQGEYSPEMAACYRP